MNKLEELMERYEEKFGEMIPLKMIHMTEDELEETLDECLKTGKAYELPEDIKRLMELGVEF